MIFAALVLHQEKLVTLPVEFIELTRFADELTRVSGKIYKIDPSLSRETVYLSTKDWSVENVSKRIAAAFRAEWQKEGDVLVFRRNSTVLAKMREEESDLIRQRIIEQREKEIDPICQKLGGDTLPYRLELAKERETLRAGLGESGVASDGLNQLDAVSFKLLPEYVAVRDCVNQTPQNWWSQSEPSEKLHFANVPHALARRMNSYATVENRILEQSRLDSDYLAKHTVEGKAELEHYLNVSMRRKPAQGPITLWTTVRSVSPTSWSVGCTSWNRDLLYVGGSSATLDIAKKNPLPEEDALEPVLSKRVDDPKNVANYYGKAPMERADFEPAQVAFGPALSEIRKVIPELTVIAPDEAIPITPYSLKSYRQPFKTVKEALDHLSSIVTWSRDKAGVLVARPELMLRHEKFRSNHKAVRQLARQIRERSFMTLEDGIELAKSQPILGFNRYAMSIEEAYEIPVLDSVSHLYDSNYSSTFRFLGELQPAQLQALLEGGVLLGRQLSSKARRLLADCPDASSLQTDANPNAFLRRSPRSLKDVMAFVNGITDRTEIVRSASATPNLILRPGKGGSSGIYNYDSVAINQFWASVGKADMYYPKFHAVTFQPITLHSLLLTLSDGPASARIFAAFTGVPGVEVKSVAELPQSIRDSLGAKLDYLRQNSGAGRKPPPSGYSD